MRYFKSRRYSPVTDVPRSKVAVMAPIVSERRQLLQLSPRGRVGLCPQGREQIVHLVHAARHLCFVVVEIGVARVSK